LFSDWLCAPCQHPSRLLIGHKLASHWNIPLEYIWSSTFMELLCHSDLHPILCSKKLIVVCLVFFLNKFFSAHLIKLWKEMSWPHQWCCFYLPYSCGEVRIWASK
jgi:hypothetical protein